jgi:effector-binding domain-containing protein
MTKEKLAFQEALAFEVWMRETVKTIHYANHDKMSEAYNRVVNNYLELKVYESIKPKRN